MTQIDTTIVVVKADEEIPIGHNTHKLTELGIALGALQATITNLLRIAKIVSVDITVKLYRA